MSTITGAAGAGAALPPVVKTIGELKAEYPGQTLTERDGGTITADATEVYLIAHRERDILVVLKATADAEGNANPLQGVKID